MHSRGRLIRIDGIEQFDDAARNAHGLRGRFDYQDAVQQRALRQRHINFVGHVLVQPVLLNVAHNPRDLNPAFPAVHREAFSDRILCAPEVVRGRPVHYRHGRRVWPVGASKYPAIENRNVQRLKIAGTYHPKICHRKRLPGSWRLPFDLEIVGHSHVAAEGNHHGDGCGFHPALRLDPVEQRLEKGQLLFVRAVFGEV